MLGKNKFLFVVYLLKEQKNNRVKQLSHIAVVS
jgi:hypothetical protein